MLYKLKDSGYNTTVASLRIPYNLCINEKYSCVKMAEKSICLTDFAYFLVKM